LTLANGVVVEYDYDGASQLTGITYRNGAAVLGNLTYSYDNNGRRTQVGGSYARTGLASALASTTHNAANQLTQRGATTFTYDTNGNIQGDGTSTYTWNARDQLVSMTAPSLTASFQYDALGRRINKTINSVSTSYLYDGNNAVQELQGPTPVANILNGGLDEAYSRTDGDGARTLLSDGPGSTVALLDSTGTAMTQYTYEPFGNTSTSGVSSSNPSQYTGRENDSTGLYYYRGRYYSPSLQRFISEDPIGIAGGINLYAYVNNNPITYRDPFGLDKDLKVRDFITDKIGGGVTLGGEVVNTTGVSYDNAVNRLTSMGFKPYWDPHPAHWGGMYYEGKVCGNWYHVTVGYPAKTYGGYYDLDDPWTFMQIHSHEWAPHNHLLEMLAKQFMRGPFDLGP
jgi:RHS repeat-associated protein